MTSTDQPADHVSYDANIPANVIAAFSDQYGWPAHGQANPQLMISSTELHTSQPAHDQGTVSEYVPTPIPLFPQPPIPSPIPTPLSHEAFPNLFQYAQLLSSNDDRDVQYATSSLYNNQNQLPFYGSSQSTSMLFSSPTSSAMSHNYYDQLATEEELLRGSFPSASNFLEQAGRNINAPDNSQKN
ncbi:hypothetical protein Pint_02513 [Pistacia integerrima]|uniref:Uncharacterized protein n=1 Tax=Pistacia integerrima TaxID=434235 RepID=A0ACC0ZJK4_9ROSI|nr:hypothetical protein Pint_02513 [Pistacia integerrima]